MAEDFDSQLGRLFSQAPGFPDNDAFAAVVASRLDRAWTLRRLMIGAGGLAAGLVVAWQFIAGRLNGGMVLVAHDTVSAFGTTYAQAFSGFEELMSMQAGGETLWFGAALAAVALAFGATRVVENL